MKPNDIGIALAGGAASALLFYTLTASSTGGLLLVYLSPLPLMIVALGWGWATGLIAIAAAALVLGGTLHPLIALAYCGTIGAPSLLLAAMANARRNPDLDSRDFSEVGLVLLQAALFGALIACASLAFTHFDLAAYQAHIRDLATLALTETPRIGWAGFSKEQQENILNIVVIVLPLGAAIIATLTLISNLHLGALVVQQSGRLTRPWPTLNALTLPLFASLSFLVLAALAFLSDSLFGLIAGIFAAALCVPLILQGLAVVHAITRGLALRGLMLGILYITLALFGWPALVLLLLGLIEPYVRLRAKFSSPSSTPLV